jgi:phthiocerol/phenolphthiocerol synthesis type-I polyketide synthase E
LIERGTAFHRVDGSHFVVRSDSAEDLAAVGMATRPAGAIHLWGMGSDALSARGIYDALVAVGVGLGSVSAGVPVRVIHASARVESVFDETEQKPQSALAWGPVLVLPTEMPHLRMRSVDLEVTDDLLDAPSVTFALMTEAAAGDLVSQSAWRRGRRWLKRYEPISLPPVRDSRLPLKSQGVYFISGALGGIGLTLARWLAREFKARLLLTARSALPPREEWDAWLATQPAHERSASAIAAIRAIEADGGEVIVAAADATDEAAMSAAITLAALQSAEAAGAVLSPKVTGLEVLVRLLGQVSLDFVVLMSSENGVLGVPGTCAYSAANAVLDAFAEGSARPSAWRHVVSFNWGAWRDVGMAANLAVPQARRAYWQALLAAAIPPALGVEAFARGLASRRRRVVVLPYDLLAELRKRESVTFAPTAVASPQAQASRNGALARPELSTVYDEPQSDLERRLASIWTQVLGVDRIGRHDDFFELGGHSLLGTRVLALVLEALGSRLELREIFDAPTVHKMAQRIEAGAGSEAPGAAGSVTEEREELEF